MKTSAPNKKNTDIIQYLRPLIIGGVSDLDRILHDEGINISEEKENIAIRLKHIAAKLSKKHKYIYMEIPENELSKSYEYWMSFEDFSFDPENKTYIGSNMNTGVMFCIRIVPQKDSSIFVIDEAHEYIKSREAK